MRHHLEPLYAPMNEPRANGASVFTPSPFALVSDLMDVDSITMVGRTQRADVAMLNIKLPALALALAPLELFAAGTSGHDKIANLWRGNTVWYSTAPRAGRTLRSLVHQYHTRAITGQNAYHGSFFLSPRWWRR